MPGQTARQLNTRARANQNAQVQFVQTKHARAAIRAKHDAHGSRITRLMCTCVRRALIATSSIFCAHAGYFACIFRNMSSRAVATRVCRQV